MMHLHDHFRLLLREERALALRDILRQSVGPGCRVLDAGCGCGLLGLWAARFGAAEVVGVDLADLSLARELARANGLGQSIRFLRHDLASLEPEALGGRFDLLLAMLYYNDPRRDEATSELVSGLCSRFLAPGGEAIPGAVRYTAHPCEWSAQDVASRRLELEEQVSAMELRYGLRLRPLLEQVRRQPDPAWFPRRLPSGELDRSASRALGPETPFTTIDYSRGSQGYPDKLLLEIEQPGVLTTVVWVQELLHKDRLIFRNESVSWVDRPCAVTPGTRVVLELGHGWRSTNVLAVAEVLPG